MTPDNTPKYKQASLLMVLYKVPVLVNKITRNFGDWIPTNISLRGSLRKKIVDTWTMVEIILALEATIRLLRALQTGRFKSMSNIRRELLCLVVPLGLPLPELNSLMEKPLSLVLTNLPFYESDLTPYSVKLKWRIMVFL